MAIVLVGGIGHIVFSEWKASQEFDMLNTPGEYELKPFLTGPTTSWNSLDENERAKAEQAWSRVFELSFNCMTQQDPSNFFPDNKYANSMGISPNQDWKQEVFVAETLEYLKPVIEHLEVAVEFPFPNVVNSADGTFLLGLFDNRLRWTVDILQLEVVHAIYHGEKKRALQGLELLAAVSNASDSQNFHYNRYGMGNQAKYTHWALLSESLTNADWTLEELNQLQQQIDRSLEIDTQIADAAKATRFLHVKQLEKNQVVPRNLRLDPIHQLHRRIWQLPSYKLATFKAANDLVERNQNGNWRASYLQTLQSSPHIQQPANWDQSISTPDFSYFDSQVVSPLVSTENMRRLLVTGIAIKKFQIAEKKWPSQMSDLNSIGLVKEDYTSVLGSPFFLEVVDVSQAEPKTEEPEAEPGKKVGQVGVWVGIPRLEIPRGSEYFEERRDQARGLDYFSIKIR